MDAKTIMFVIAGFFALVTTVSAGACYTFDGNGRVSLTDNINFSTKAHFRFKFKTKIENAVMYYAEGTYHRERTFDFEGVFLRDGFLHYFLFNPPDFSIGSSFGFRGRSRTKVNDGRWHLVEFYRNKDVQINDLDGSSRTVQQTGFKLDGVVQAGDNYPRHNVNIYQPIILGQDPHLADRTSQEVGNFKGKIKDFEDMNSNHVFSRENESLNGVTHCISTVDAV